jgi:hypothetical protein
MWTRAGNGAHDVKHPTPRLMEITLDYCEEYTDRICTVSRLYATADGGRDYEETSKLLGLAGFRESLIDMSFKCAADKNESGVQITEFRPHPTQLHDLRTDST